SGPAAARRRAETGGGGRRRRDARPGQSGTAPGTVGASWPPHPPLCRRHGKARRPRHRMPRAQVRRPATKSTGCGAEGVAAAMPAWITLRLPSSVTPRNPCAYVGVRATEDCMRHPFPAAVAASILLFPLLALPAGARADGGATDLDTVLVTGSRSQERLADSLVPAEVIERDEIERSQARDLIELLGGRAGIDV